MNEQKTNHRMTVGIIVLLACVGAVALIPLLRHATKPSTAVPVAIQTPAPAEKPAAAVPEQAPVAATQPAAEPQPAPVEAAAPVPQAQPVAAAPAPDRVIPITALEAQGGIQISHAWLTMGDTEVEIHYAITSYQKAEELAKKGLDSYLIDQTTGAKIPMAQPPPERVTRARSRALSMALMTPEAGGFPPLPYRLQLGRTYAIMVPNRGGLLKVGSKVTVDVGGLPSPVLAVE
jgi:hypothetical protein